MAAGTSLRLATVMLSVTALALSAGPATRADPTADPGHPPGHREDRGALIVLDLYGTYEEMGRQEVDLLGDVGREAYEVYAERWRRVILTHGLFARFVNGVVFPLWGTIGSYREDSSFFDEGAGIAGTLAVERADAVRLLYGAVFGGASTAFVATRSATADGHALIGRNVDWSDDGGRRRPVVMRYHPTNGDLAYLNVAWPLIGVPFVGLNAAGLAVSINFFDADDLLGLGPPRLLYRRIMQQARTVDEAFALLADGGNRGGAAFLVLADANGAIGLAECAAKRCAFHRPAEDWLAQSNHSRTPEMHDHDEGRMADTYRRRAAMEAAVRRRLGALTPIVASEILRDRTNSRFINDSTVANLRVLNAAVVEPAAGILWHSTTLQPIAPFGEMVPLTVDGDSNGIPSLPADPGLGGDALRREVEVVAMMRQASRLFAVGRTGDAGLIWDRMADERPQILEPSRLDWARARVRWSTGLLAAADALLGNVVAADAPFEVGAYASVARAMIADRQGRREEALRRWAAAAAFLDAHPEWDGPSIVRPLRTWIAAGLAAPGKGRLPPMPDLQWVPQ